MPELDAEDDSHLLGMAGNAKALSIHSDSCADSVLGLSELEDDEPPLDQKHLNLVHEELEKLNIATDVINKLEVQLDGARACFREIQASWSEKLKELSKKYSTAIAKARPYYEAKIQERKLRDESQRAAIRFERATSLLAVAKQQVALTQDSLNRQTTVHPECLENAQEDVALHETMMRIRHRRKRVLRNVPCSMRSIQATFADSVLKLRVLNHHIQRVNEAEEERLASGDEHRAISERLMKLADQIRKMEKDQRWRIGFHHKFWKSDVLSMFRSSIKKSRTYFDQRLEFTRVLERQKELILRLEAEVIISFQYFFVVRQKKCDYTTSLRNLERISDSIHEQRSIGSGSAREPPANPPPYQPTAPPPYDDDDDGRYAISQETDEVIAPVLCLMRANGCADWPQRPAGIGSGVILLAQQLIGGGERRESEPTISHYRTLPQGIPNSPSDSSEVSSLASVRTSGLGFTDDEALSGMLRSHSTLIQVGSWAFRPEKLI
ncbi:unnamed protein product [Strongylus vulgaris]|uniref:Uncharacterized protein n=1 Tax=Strongylus vulgaris TaxID=40348 RepID=A0A3P7IYH4_STRVU|nr:unnamed protein product [Strongylus vulgaris]